MRPAGPRLRGPPGGRARPGGRSASRSGHGGPGCSAWRRPRAGRGAASPCRRLAPPAAPRPRRRCQARPRTCGRVEQARTTESVVGRSGGARLTCRPAPAAGPMCAMRQLQSLGSCQESDVSRAGNRSPLPRLMPRPATSNGFRGLERRIERAARPPSNSLSLDESSSARRRVLTESWAQRPIVPCASASTGRSFFRVLGGILQSVRAAPAVNPMGEY